MMEKPGTNRLRRVLQVVILMFFANLVSFPAAAQEVDEETVQIEQLARDIERAMSLRDVKNLQYTYSQYAQYGLVDEIVTLFSDEAKIQIEDDAGTVIAGKKPIHDYFVEQIGSRSGLSPDQLFTHMFYTPVVTLSDDGLSATGRWTDLGMRGTVGESADWFGGMQVNDYVRENGVWKFSRIHIYPLLAGSYSNGFFAPTEHLPEIPYHYSSAQAGRPVPAESGDADRSPRGFSLAEVEAQTQAMNDEDKVRNLLNIYGYYADRKMWDDVADLFAADGAMEIAGIGIYEGADSIRRGLERDGPVGLKYGQVHDQIQLHTVVEVDPNGVEARTRGMQLGLLTPQLGEAYWMVSTLENRYFKQDGIWRILEMRIYPKMKTDYYQGWHKSVVIDPVPEGDLAPDRAPSAENSPQTSAVIPAFFDNPVTGRPVGYPEGYRVVANDRLVAAPGASVPEVATGEFEKRLAEARRKLNVSKAWDAIENISSTFGPYLDDYQWQRYVENYAVDGWRKKGAGEVYIGRDAIFKAEAMSYGPSPTMPKDWVRLHNRLQPVIDVSEDAQSAYFRTRLFLYFSNSRSPGSFDSGMYPNDSAVVEDGIWKLKIGGWVDGPYFRSGSYALGWAKPGETPAEPPQGRAPTIANDPDDEVAQSRRGFRYPPDIAADQQGRRGYGASLRWPDIKPMWFHYANPVSGRIPEFYCPDVIQCIEE